MNEAVYKAPERIDSTSYGQVDENLKGLIKGGAERIIFDMTELTYISSAGLRVLLKTHKELNSAGGIILTNVPGAVREILDMTGFSGILTIK